MKIIVAPKNKPDTFILSDEAATTDGVISYRGDYKKIRILLTHGPDVIGLRIDAPHKGAEYRRCECTLEEAMEDLANNGYELQFHNTMAEAVEYHKSIRELENIKF